MSSLPDLPASLTLRRLILWPICFFAILFSAHTLVLFARRFVWFDCPPHWPLSIYNPRGPHSLVEYAAIAATIGLGIATIEVASRKRYRTREIAVFGILLILASNAIQGVPKGFFNPVAGGKAPEQYYHDSRNVDDAATFLRHFEVIQPSLHTHARTHPPGAVLLFYGMRRAFGDNPACMAIAIAVVSTLLSVWAFPIFARYALGSDDRLAGYGTLLYLCLPAVQIYYCATLDALVGSLLLGAVAVWIQPPTLARSVLASLLIAVASFLNFGFIWVLPIIFGLDFLGKRVRRWWIPILTLVVLYSALYLTFGFNYLASGRIASHLENPRGYRLLVEPISFGFTRIEDVSEIAVFFGPFLLCLAAIGISKLRSACDTLIGYQTFLLSTGTLLALFLTGAYHTGETARACIFIYPALLLPVLAAVRGASESDRPPKRLLYLVLTQAIIMQSTGNFFW